tara:strand:- start:264 stop:1145 length:882 start_codon:yes stop_codon:yes gene_type:complete
MATIDLGKIKLVWRGSYAGGTDYTVDDVVQHTDSGLTSSFICTTNSTGNAPSTGGSVHGSWAYLAKGGTAGTDVGTTITTQGDLLYRDGSGLQRLAKGTAGQALKMNTAANAPEWGTDTGGLVLLSRQSITSNVTSVDFNNTIITSAYDNYLFIFQGIDNAIGNDDMGFLTSSDNGSSFSTVSGAAWYMKINGSGTGQVDNYAYHIAALDSHADANGTNGWAILNNVNSTGVGDYKTFTGMGQVQNHGTAADNYSYFSSAVVKDPSVLNFVKFYNASGNNLTDGIVTCYGYAQ